MEQISDPVNLVCVSRSERGRERQRRLSSHHTIRELLRESGSCSDIDEDEQKLEPSQQQQPQQPSEQSSRDGGETNPETEREGDDWHQH